MGRRYFNCGPLLFAWLLLISVTMAWSAEETSKDNDVEREKRLAEMKKRVTGIEVHSAMVAEHVKQKARENPLLRFNDSARTLRDGAIWSFGDQGRPILLVTFERYPMDWAWELISTSTNHFTAKLSDGWQWSPEKPGLVFRALPGVERPADEEAKRLRQMKSFARRFAASELTHDQQRFELRLLSQPILRYSDLDSGLVDGAMFAFAYGTNPEVIVLLECQKAKSGNVEWFYAMIPMTTAAAEATLDGKEVWKKSPHPSIPRSQEPYTYFGEPILESQR